MNDHDAPAGASPPATSIGQGSPVVPASPPPPAEALRVEVQVVASEEVGLRERTAPVLRLPDVARDFQDADHWLVGWDIANKVEGRPFMAFIADTVSGRMTVVDGLMDGVASDDSLSYLPFERPPSDDEFSWACRVLAEDLASTSAGVEVAGIASPGFQAPGESVYRPFPPLATRRAEDGSVTRMVAVGLRSPEGRHRMVAVEVGTGYVHDLGPRGDGEPGSEFGLVPADGDDPPAGSGQRFRVKVHDGEEVLWDLIVARPSASSGLAGSGVELAEVDFAGVRVLDRAHVPIVTVAPAEADGPTVRLWLHEEGSCDAPPAQPADDNSGLRELQGRPPAPFEAGVDGGGFRGVTLAVDGRDLVITSAMRAGVHRLSQSWILGADGSVQGRMAWAPALQPGPAVPVEVTAHWRLDFDIAGPADNTVQEYNQPPVHGTGPWHTIRYEMRRSARHPLGSPEAVRRWRVRNRRSSRSYTLSPGPHGGDVWLLRYHHGETDDGRSWSTGYRSEADLDALLTGEPLHGEDVVLWCSTTARGGPGPTEAMGPDLIPGQWSRSSPLAEPELL
ncbi:MAG: hypothetical protein ACT4OS_00495 [Acidimicrobiales bacterium]